MKLVKFNDWILEIDVEKTLAFYKTDMEVCKCLYCCNYGEAVKNNDDSVTSFLGELGIMPDRPVEVSEFPMENSELLHYIGFYHIVGKVLKGETCTISDWQDHHTYQLGAFEFCLSWEVEQVQKNFPQPIIQLNFDVKLPWVLKEYPG